MDDNTILKKAKIGIILNDKLAFFASLMMKRPFIADESIKTFCTDGKVIKYNPAFMETLTHHEVIGVICHELLHITLMHHLRREKRDPETWNEAADYAINPILKDAGLQLPKGVLLKAEYRDMTAEAIYAKLSHGKQQQQDDKDDQQGQGDGKGDQQQGQGQPQQGKGQPDPNAQPDNGIGGVEDSPAASEAEVAQAVAETKQEVAAAAQIAKQQGRLPASLARLVEEVLEQKVAWQEKIARFLSGMAKNDYSFSRPNMRYAGSGFILPSLYNLEVGNIVLAVDTSGSTFDGKQLERFATEMQELCSMFKSPIHVAYCDVRVKHSQVIEPDEDFKLEPVGGGGTDFKPPFKWVEEQDLQPKALIYFTDGCCNSFAPEPEYPVMWAQTSGHPFKPPYGEVINID